jgi:hypothetical protein
MPWTGGVPEELVKKLEAKNLAVCIYRRDPDFWIPPERDLWLDISRRVAGADARRSRWEGV